MNESENTIIRCAERGDLDEIRSILNYYVMNSPYSWAKRIRRAKDMSYTYHIHQLSDCTPFMVAERDRHILGFAMLSIVSNIEGWEHVAEDAVYLNHEYIGQGLGTQLLEAVMERGQKSGLWAVTSRIDAENIASLALHRSFGFEEYGTLRNVGIKFGERRSCVNMVYYY